MPYNLDIPGQVSELQLKAIEAVASLVPENGVVVEIGSLFGRSSYAWSKSVPASAEVNCIDPWEGNAGIRPMAERLGINYSIDQFKNYINGCGNIVAHQGYSPIDFADWRRDIDVYYEDAVHNNPVLRDNITFWSARLKLTGVACGDEYRPRFPDVVAEVNALAERLDRELITIEHFWCLLPRAEQSKSIEHVRVRLLALRDEAEAMALSRPFAHEFTLEGKFTVCAGDELELNCVIANQSPQEWRTPHKELLQGLIVVEFQCSSGVLHIAAAVQVPEELAPDQPVAVKLSVSTRGWAGGFGRLKMQLLLCEPSGAVIRRLSQKEYDLEVTQSKKSASAPAAYQGTHKSQDEDYQRIGPLDVYAAYRTFLGRVPDDADVVQRHLTAANSLTELRRRFITAPEFGTAAASLGFGKATPLVAAQREDGAAGQTSLSGELLVDAYVDEIRRLRPVDMWRNFQSGITEAEFRERCGQQMIWHSVDLGDLFIEGRRKTAKVTAREMRLAKLPDLRGKSVLDVGAFGGWFSFEAERRGATSVTALDYYSWCYDWPKIHRWVAAERAAGRNPDTYDPPAECVDPIRQPGRIAFDLTKEILGSKVVPILGLAEELQGMTFDVVLYLGVLYHTRNPFLSLKKVADMTRDILIVETLGLHVPGQQNKALWEFYDSDSINSDSTTWWAPTAAGLVSMLKACGFSQVAIHDGTDVLSESQLARVCSTRLWVQAMR